MTVMNTLAKVYLVDIGLKGEVFGVSHLTACADDANVLFSCSWSNDALF